MTDTLTAEQIADIERILSEQATSVTPYSDETDCLVWAALPGLIAMAKQSIQSGSAIQLCDDGSKVLLSSYAGGAHPDGAWSGLSLMFIQADGTQVVRRYVDATASEKAETEATLYRERAVRLAKIVTDSLPCTAQHNADIAALQESVS